MKYIKTFEENWNEEFENRKSDYDKYYNKFILFKYLDDYYFGKYNETTKNNRADIDYYTWNSIELDFDCRNTHTLLFYEMEIISSFDTYEEAKNEYNMIIDTKKFNI